ncbi:7-carboxy-7-deazaguanine synthase [Halomonas sp. HNIBRBA4712]|uniref:7-carboxy-7-deazaguanine synthase n=1 Tax=Halomonas sp. HNIBRBA4712 TaxID=3373087 RepID=UPI00374569EB
MYHVKEAFYTLQGEGAQAGRASVFCRFTGCNLWSGLEKDRAGARCTFCDTDFIGVDGEGGGRFDSAEALGAHIKALWPDAAKNAVPYVVFTGGEPLLQLDPALIKAIKAEGFEIGVETNGTVSVPDGIDWLCVSPKGANALKALEGDELKLVYPQCDAAPERFETLGFRHFFLQPMDQGGAEQNQARVAATTAYCMKHPQWRLSLQTHKIAGFA